MILKSKLNNVVFRIIFVSTRYLCYVYILRYWLKECEYAREKKQKPNFAKCVLKLYGTEYLKCAMIFILVGVLQ